MPRCPLLGLVSHSQGEGGGREKYIPRFWLVIKCLGVISRSGLSKLMKSRASELEVNMLLYAIQKTTSFEKLLAQRFLNSKFMESVRCHHQNKCNIIDGVVHSCGPLRRRRRQTKVLTMQTLMTKR